MFHKEGFSYKIWRCDRISFMTLAKLNFKNKYDKFLIR